MAKFRHPSRERSWCLVHLRAKRSFEMYKEIRSFSVGREA